MRLKLFIIVLHIINRFKVELIVYVSKVKINLANVSTACHLLCDLYAVDGVALADNKNICFCSWVEIQM